MGKTDLDPIEDKADHTLAFPVATTDPIYQSSPESDSEGGEKSTWWGTERNPQRRQSRRSSGRLRRKSLMQPVWPGRLKEERGTMACRTTWVH
jgi:hypothetical protein